MHQAGIVGNPASRFCISFLSVCFRLLGLSARIHVYIRRCSICSFVDPKPIAPTEKAEDYVFAVTAIHTAAGQYRYDAGEVLVDLLISTGMISYLYSLKCRLVLQAGN